MRAVDLLLISDDLARHLYEQERRHFERMARNAVPWRDDLPFAEELCVQAATYTPDALFDVPAVRGTQRVLDPGNCAASPDGRFVYCRRVLPRGASLKIRLGRRRGVVYFDGDVTVPILAERIPGQRQPETWMSLTPSEMFTLRPGVRAARGKVLVAGLGLGWLLRKVCEKKTVTEVTVVERSRTLLDWVGPALRAKYPCLKKVKSWVCDDAVEHTRQNYDEGTTYLFDIWQAYRDARDDRQFQALKARLKRVWAWGDVSE